MSASFQCEMIIAIFYCHLPANTTLRPHVWRTLANQHRQVYKSSIIHSKRYFSRRFCDVMHWQLYKNSSNITGQHCFPHCVSQSFDIQTESCLPQHARQQRRRRHACSQSNKVQSFYQCVSLEITPMADSSHLKKARIIIIAKCVFLYYADMRFMHTFNNMT